MPKRDYLLLYTQTLNKRLFGPIVCLKNQGRSEDFRKVGAKIKFLDTKRGKIFLAPEKPRPLIKYVCDGLL